jgi:hypothetical protein
VALLEAALFPEFDLPPPPPGHPYKVQMFDGYQVGYMPGGSFALVSVRRLSGDVGEHVARIRALLAAEGFRRAAWTVPEAAEPTGLTGTLKASGLVSWPGESEGFGARYRNMLLTTEPDPMPGGVTARQVATFEEFVAGRLVTQDVFGMTEQDRDLAESKHAVQWEWHERHPDFKSFAAFVDGEIVGSANAIFGAHAAYLIGGSVRERARGRGAYKALVRARWDAAVERGTPALTVSAGSMSGPILERLGFATVGEGDGLEDRFPAAS